MTRLLPKSLFGRLVLVLLVVLVLAQLAGAAILLKDRARALYEAGGLHTAQRIASIVRALETVPESQRPILLRAVNTPALRVRLTAASRLPETSDEDRGARRISMILSRLIGDEHPVRVRVMRPGKGEGRVPPAGVPDMPGPGVPGPQWGNWNEDWRWAGEEPPRRGWGGQQYPFRRLWRGPRPGLRYAVAARLGDGTWAEFIHRPAQEPYILPRSIPIALAVLLASVVAVSLLAVRWITRPLHTLGEAADELGRDIHRPPLDTDGPAEVARAARAFNTMQARIARYVKDREEMLAAVSHDLKTPITRLRLRAEMTDDAAFREKMLADLDDMEQMVAATLEFMRDAARAEPVRRVDVRALVESIAEDLAETGGRVRVSGDFPAEFGARPTALKRCLTNLMENAVKYGETAEVSCREEGGELVITVADRGPGIAGEELDRVFEPFVRLEASRSRETGGAGLGLSIARGIARAHGGELTLANRPEGGLLAMLRLPGGRPPED